MSSVTKTDGFQAYHVRAGHGDYEWATILIRGFQATGNDGQPREVGEILIHSSFGSWAYQWSHLGQPFKAWLASCDDKHYVAAKFLGDKDRVFDGEATVKDLRQSLIEHRRTGDLTKNDARSIWDWIEENELELGSSVDLFVERMRSCAGEADWQDRDAFDKYQRYGPGRGAVHFLAEPWDRISRTLDRSFAGFWRDIMPPFQEALRAELAKEIQT